MLDLEKAAFVVDALDALGPEPAWVGEVGRSCRITNFVSYRWLRKLEALGFVTRVLQPNGHHRKWALTKRGEAFRQAIHAPTDILVLPTIGQVCNADNEA